MEGANEVHLQGKISKVGRASYTPSGIAICEVVLAVSQKHLEKESVGYFDLVFTGEQAVDVPRGLKVGDRISVEGRLWCRTYKNRMGLQVSETKVLVNQLGGTSGRKSKEV